ncbi:sensor histidine kinase [Actinomyces minihominis]|uniref:sensor histidine kinase n=1 Tax=Actinomyces minihominis TaxID=2002838 RepID=UPI000C07A8E7|nr:ATP-binding protein [Actinomyces minihominis]
MSSPWRGAHTSLQVRLVALISTVLVIVIAAIGTVAVTLQNDSLRRRLDEQLQTSMSMALGSGNEYYIAGTPPNLQIKPVDPRFGSLKVKVLGDQTWEAEVVDFQGATTYLEEAAVDKLVDSVKVTGVPYNVYLKDQGAYRVLAQGVTNGYSNGVVIVGQSLADVKRTTKYLVGVFILTALLAIVVASGLAAFMVRRTLRPLRTLQATAATISETSLTSGVVTFPQHVSGADYPPGSEVGDLADSFNQMMDHVEAALQHREASEEKLKRFAADAGHELRTPLATISGYSEFAERQADVLPEHVVRSLERISSESKRMGGIVEDLLLLARLDSGQPVGEGRTLVAPVVLDATMDARVTAPDHHWTVQMSDSVAEAEVPLAGDILRQALANLLTNARLHTPAGTTVTTSVSVDSSLCIIQVEDDGPGIDPELASRVFDRFVRGDSARSPLQDSPDGSTPQRSTGLGLAITHQIIENSGGSVSLSTAPGRTVFTLQLPLVR